MARRPHPKQTTNNPADGPWQTCMRCGFVTSQNRIRMQYDFQGGSVPQSLGWLVCPKCEDPLTWQRKLLILPPDPKPFYNTNPEPYAVDETDWLTTQDGDIITTEDADPLITDIPNPADDANTTYLMSSIVESGGFVATVYLDLFDGDPSSGGVSVLAAITGSATRTNIASDLTTDGGVATNTAAIVVAAAAASTTNVSYVGIYDAATGGTLQMSGTVSATYPTIAEGTAVQFPALGLTIDLN